VIPTYITKLPSVCTCIGKYLHTKDGGEVLLRGFRAKSNLGGCLCIFGRVSVYLRDGVCVSSGWLRDGMYLRESGLLLNEIKIRP
jgi:hypothetical protein